MSAWGQITLKMESKMTIKEATTMSKIYKETLSQDIANTMIDKMIASEIEGY